MNDVEPTLVVKILHKNAPMLADTGAHVSVLPKQLILEKFRSLRKVTPNGTSKLLAVKKLFWMDPCYWT